MNSPCLTPSKSIIIFDGHCHFCNAVIRFILKRDRHNRFLVSPVQDPVSRKVLRERGINFASLFTVYLVEENGVKTKSAAVFSILKTLPFPWNMFSVFRIIPVFITDTIYSFISRNRFIFGRSETKVDQLKLRFGDRFLK